MNSCLQVNCQDWGTKMYAYKIVVTTLLILEMISLVFAGLKASKSGKITSMAFFVLSGMAIAAIWG